MKSIPLLLLLWLVYPVFTITAQTTHAIIEGTVVDHTSEPLMGVSVMVKNESTGFSTATITDMNGKFSIKQLPLGKPYTITVSYLGFGTQTRTGYELNQGDALRVDFKMEESAEALDEVVVSASELKNTIKNFGAATSVTARDLQKLPVNGRNFTSLIDLSPLSTGNSLSGQLPSSTNFTVDGMTARNPTSGGTANRRGGSYAISMEAIREFKVSTNQYDVTYGRSGGGSINTVTKSGTNTLTGSIFTFARTDWLSSPNDIRGNKRDEDFSSYQYGFSLGGPIIKDKMHFFVAWDHQEDTNPLQIADIRTPEDERRYNVSQQSLDRFLDIARSKYGVADSPQFGSFNRKRGTDAVFARIDWQLNEKNLLTLRNNYVFDLNRRGISDNSRINLYEVYGNVRTTDNSFLASLRSELNPKMTNELKFQYLRTSESAFPGDQIPSANIPRAIVERVQSQVNGNDVFTTIQLGGQRYIPESFYNNVFQLVDNLYYSTDKIDYTFGIDLMYTHMKSVYGSEMNGRFYFTGLDDFENLDPYRYVREVNLMNDPAVTQNIIATGAYAQMQTNLFPGFEFMAGIRADYTNYMDKPNFNEIVYEDLGLRTDKSLTTFQLQPRIQATWDIGERQKDILRFGAGIFGADINNYVMINNMVFDGTRVASVDINRNDVDIPTPDFPGYRADPSTAPGAEILEELGITPINTINMNGDDVKIPTLYKANLSYNRFFTDRFKMGLSLYASFARNNYMYTDANMVDDPYFRLANEGNRGVYVPANTIDPSNGAANWAEGRKTDRVGRVLKLNSDGKVNNYAVVLDGTYQYFEDGILSFSYTWNDTKDNTSFNGDVANTATLVTMTPGDPRDLGQMNYSNNHFRHKLVLYGSLPTFHGFSLSFRYSGFGGTRYSLIVNGNVNGDFVSSNDLAYIFDPGNPATPAAYREGIEQILNNPEASEHLKDYIRDSYGKISGRNGGVNDFFGTWDVSLRKRFNTFKSQYVELSADVFNLANMLNKKWGARKTLGNQNIYSIGGFDTDSNTYNYNVNPNTGVTSPSGNPYQIQLGIRYGF